MGPILRKKVTLTVKGEDFALESLSDEERANLLSLVQGDPLLLNLYVLRELMIIKQRQDLPEWTQKYEYTLDVARTNELIDQFPTRGAKYVYVHTASGTVTLNFDSQNEPTWTLAARDQFRLPFDRLYLSWTGQATKKLIFYVSNREILRTTLA